MRDVGQLEREPLLRDAVAADVGRRRSRCSRAGRPSPVATSRSSLVRSSASTWIVDGERRRAAGLPRHLDEPVGLAARATSRSGSRCGAPTRPGPRVTNPTISSPGTGVQQRASFTQTSLRPSTMTAPVGRGLLPEVDRPDRRDLLGLLLRLLGGQPRQPRHDRLRRHLALADRDVQRVHARVPQVARDLRHRAFGHQPADRAATACGGTAAAGRGRSPARPRGAPARTTGGSSSGPAATARSPASRGTARRPGPST